MATTKKPAAKKPAAKAAPAKKSAPATAKKKQGGVAGALDRYFMISKRGSTFGTEIRGGLTTFFTMAYIVVLNPIIIGTVASADGTFLGGGTEPNLPLVAAATALVAGVVTILMGVWARFPLALAAGLGLNAFVTYGLVVNAGISWKEAMGLVVIEGLVILVLVLTGFRVAVFKAVPLFMKKAIAVGIGLFLAFIGLWDAGIVTAGAGVPTQFGGGNNSITTLPMVVFIVGLIVAIVLVTKKVKGALLISIVAATIVAFVIERIEPQEWALVTPTLDGAETDFTPDLSLIGQVDLFGSWATAGIIVTLMLVFSLLVVDFFDTMGTMTAIGEEAGLTDKEGNLADAREILVVDSIGAAAGGFGGVSSNTSYIESAAGVGDGARTGLASVVTGIAFILAMFLSPVYALVPFEAATPVLVVVGFLMVSQVVGIDWKKMEIAIPAFLTFILMPFGFSIALGIGAGFISYVVLQIAVGKAKGIHALMWISSAAFVLYFALTPLQNWLGL